MLFTDLLKDDLVAAAKYYKVEVEPNWTKDRIATALLDAGKTPEQWEKDREANDHGEDVANGGAITTDDLRNADAEQDDSDESDDEDDVEQSDPEEVDEELILVRFTGNNKSYTTGNFTFTRDLRPFALMTKEQFDALDRKKFRLASKAEAAEFYGR